jgi:DASS family divalent anion:Na+ symporter
MAATITPPVAAPAARAKWLQLGIAIAIGAVIFAIPTPAGLSKTAQIMLAIAAFTIVLWILQVMNNGVASVLMMALMIPAGVKPALALSGFSTPAFWILLAVLFYGFAMQQTGLAQRISFYILSLFPGTYSGILLAFFTIGAVLALGIPSMTVRTAIMVPIAWALVRALGLLPRSNGSALIMLTTVEMAAVPGCGLLYGSLLGPIVESAFNVKHLPLTWLAYARVMELPALVLCVLIVFGNQWLLKPERPLDASPDFARNKLRALGPLRRSEMLTALVVALSIVFWATDRWHHLPSFFIGMVGLAVFAVAGIVRDADIAGGVSWTLLLFIGGIFSLGNVLIEYKVTDWLAGYFIPIARQLTFSAMALVIVMALAMLALRFLDPSGFIAVPVLFLPICDVTGAAGIPPLVLVAPLILASVPFWAIYQNIWVAMGDGITSGEAFDTRQRLRLASGYAILTLITLCFAVAYWKLIGVLS